eukprot:6884456-Prorocentrum_lima.AAC.1
MDMRMSLSSMIPPIPLLASANRTWCQVPKQPRGPPHGSSGGCSPCRLREMQGANRLYQQWWWGGGGNALI